jgi:hypothetical protein
MKFIAGATILALAGASAVDTQPLVDGFVSSLEEVGELCVNQSALHAPLSRAAESFLWLFEIRIWRR